MRTSRSNRRLRWGPTAATAASPPFAPFRRWLSVRLLLLGLCVAASATAGEPSKLPGEWQVDGPHRDWQAIVIHHSATERGSVEAIHRHHRDVNGWDGIGYHFVIGNGRGMPDGAVESTFRWHEQRAGAHAGDRHFNDHGIGICLIGHFGKTAPTDAQLASLDRLVAALSEAFELVESRPIPHGRIKGTACPGTLFPTERLLPAEAELPILATFALPAADSRSTLADDRDASCDDPVRVAMPPAASTSLPQPSRMDPQ